MMLFRSLTNRIFFGSALLAVSAIAIAIYNVNVAVGRQSEQELQRGLDEAGTLIEEYRSVLVEHFTREARLVADLPRLKASTYENDPNTAQPLAAEYRAQLSADLFLVTGRQGEIVANAVSDNAATVVPGILRGSSPESVVFFWQHEGGILQVLSVPIWIDPQRPEILGTLYVGFSLDDRSARRFQALTNSEIAFSMDGVIRASTMPREVWPELTPLLQRDGLWTRVRLGDEEYIAATRWLDPRTPAGPDAAPSRAQVTVLRSRTAHLRFLNPLHRRLAVIAVVAVLAATLLAYAIARTVTRPLGAITATMREMAATGDLTRRIAPSSSRWEDEDARLLATTFNTMTDSIARFQRDAAQRERLLSLGRLSTVMAHEIRNPLMIIRAALRSLRSPSLAPDEMRAAVADIDEETGRLNRLVTEVLDFAKPIKFDLAPADINALCEDAVRAAGSDPPEIPVTLDLDRSLGPVVTDGERLRLALVNVLTNARHAVAARGEHTSHGPDPIRLRTRRLDRGRIAIEIADQGTGIASEDIARAFDPYFTTRRTGTGLGLAISRNIVEGLGGIISMTSRERAGTEVRIELPAGSD